MLENFRDILSAASIGKSCIRFTNANKIDFELFRQLVQDREVQVTSKLRATLGIGSEKEHRAGPRNCLDGSEPILSRVSFSGGNGVGNSLFVTRTGSKSNPAQSELDPGFYGANRGAEPSSLSSVRSDTRI